MTNDPFRFLTDFLIKNHKIDQSDEEIYLYGFREGTIYLLNFVTTLILGALFHSITESIVFLIAFVPLRIFAGGIHAKTQVRCYVLSLLTLIIIFVLINQLPHNKWIYEMIMIGSGFLLFILSPIEEENKPLNGAEFKYYRKKARIILLIELLIQVFAMVSGLFAVYCGISMAIGTLGLLVLLGKIRIRFFPRVPDVYDSNEKRVLM